MATRRRSPPKRRTVVPPSKAGMSGGEKVLLVGVGVAVVAGIFLLTRPAAAATQAPALPPAGPTGPSGATGATGATGSAELTQTATAMQTALAAHGYCQADTVTYAAFQTAVNAAGTTIGVDGYPGTVTMNQLATVLGSPATGPNGVALGLYPWTAAGGGWVAGNVPALFVGGSPSQWNPNVPYTGDPTKGCGAT